MIKFKVKHLDGGATKRVILKRTLAVYDPMSILAPFIIRDKCTIQSIWLGGCDWDEIITNSHVARLAARTE